MAAPVQAETFAPAHDNFDYEDGCLAGAENARPAPQPRPLGQIADCCLGGDRAAAGIIAGASQLPQFDYFICPAGKLFQPAAANYFNQVFLSYDSFPPALAEISSVILKE